MARNEEIEAILEEIRRVRVSTNEGNIKARADRMWELACEGLGKPVPGAISFLAEFREREGTKEAA